MQRGIILAGVLVTASGIALSGSYVANAKPFCYETGPGYEKCLSSPSGDYFNPIYQGPKLPQGSIPWVPSINPAPIFVPPAPPIAVPAPAPAPIASTGCPPGTYVNPDNLGSCLPSTPGNDFVSMAAAPSNPTAATFGTATSQAEADDIAIAQCVAMTNATCRVAAQAYHACAAFAVDTNGVFVSGGGPDIAAAAADALTAAPGAQIIGGRCADPPGNAP